jgi:hypothetical protein
MTASIPDGISFSDLQALAKEAPAEPSTPKGPYDGKTKDELIELVETIIDDAHETCGHPMIAKIMIMDITTRLLGWHSRAGIDQAEEGDNKSAMCWLRDAGKLQAILCILDTISMGPDDFVTPE